MNTKVLGIFLDQHLNFVSYINTFVRKLNFLLLMLWFLRKFLNDESVVNVYYSFIYPHLIYGLEFLGHASDYASEQVLIYKKKIKPIDMLCKYQPLIFSTIK